MKIGIFSDIHGNIYAFDKILKALNKEACDLYCFIGDICGYYYYQNEAIDRLRGMKNLVCVAGNHDRVFIDTIEKRLIPRDCNEQLQGLSGSLLMKNISDDSLSFIKELPDHYICAESGIAVFHGSPWDYLTEYVYPDGSFDKFRDLPYRFILLGHTHHPMAVCVGDVGIINPGSCGQPRDFNMPSYAVLDTDTGAVEIKRVVYDVNLMINDVIKKGDSSYLVEVLQREGERNAQR